MSERDLDDATVEAIQVAALALPEGFDFYDTDVRALAPIFAKHAPDPRPTEAEVRPSLFHWQVKVLRDLGCFRPEPAACSGAADCAAESHIQGCYASRAEPTDRGL